MDGWMIYGANGFAGRLLAEEAVRRGWTPVLAGRSRSDILRLGQRLNLPVRVFDLDTPSGIATHLRGVGLVLHCAGPLSADPTAMLQGCMQAGVHYLDLRGDIPFLEEVLDRRSRDIRSAGIVAIPGVGFEVAPTDCLAALLHERQPDARFLRMGIQFAGGAVSRATASAFVATLARGGLVREGGRLLSVPILQECLRLPFAATPSPAVAVPWGDLVSASYTTGIPNMRVYLGLPGITRTLVPWLKYARRMHSLVKYPLVQNLVQRKLEQHMREPVPSLLRKGRVTLWGQVQGAGAATAMRMHTPDGYTMAVSCALEAVGRLHEALPPPGAYTPARALGSGFVSSLGGVRVEEIQPSFLEPCSAVSESEQPARTTGS